MADMASHEEWRTRSGFVLATIGAAVGLGNIWRFSYVAGENGGAAFLLIYVLCVLAIGLPLVVAELAIGRQARGDAVTPFEAADAARPWRVAGWLGVLAAFFILGYYAVIAGWALKYFAGALTGVLWQRAAAGYGDYFASFIAGGIEPVLWQAVMLGATMLVVAGGVQRGIEVFNRWLMPLLATIVAGLAVYAMSLPGSGGGVRFLLAPDWSALARPQVYVAALGQAFFSLGLGMAIFVTYGSYVPRRYALPFSASVIAAGDTLFALVAGLAIFPAVFALGGNPAAGPELAFITLPQIFLHMPGGTVLGTLFFFLLSAAALTSMVSLLEVPVAIAINRLRARRASATLGAGALVFLAGVPAALSYGVLADVRIGRHGILDAMDTSVSNVLLPVVGLLVALFVGWGLARAQALAGADLAAGRTGRVWHWLLRYFVPAAIAVILLRSAGLV